ncbi:MAG: RNA polymerase sigma factor [Nitrospirota bacterium]
MTESQELIDQLHQGNKMVFASLVRAHQAGLLRMAKTIVFTQADAEEVLQETWLAVLGGIQNFEGRSSLKTWMYQILIYRARSRRNYEQRYVSFDEVARPHQERQVANVLQESSLAAVSSQTSYRCSTGFLCDDHTPERLSLSREILIQIHMALQRLPPVQKQVFILHHVEQLETTEICKILNLTVNNKRVLLHRARSTMRRTLQTFYRNDSDEQKKFPKHSGDTSGRMKRTRANGHDGYRGLKTNGNRISS